MALFTAGVLLGAGAGAYGLNAYRTRVDYTLGYRSGYARGVNARLTGAVEDVTRYGDADGALPKGFYDGYQDGKIGAKPATGDTALDTYWQKALEKGPLGTLPGAARAAN